MYHTQHASCWLSLCPERRTPPCCSVMKPPMLLAPLANRKMNIKCSSCFRFESHGRRTLSVWQLANLKKQEIIINSRIETAAGLLPQSAAGLKQRNKRSSHPIGWDHPVFAPCVKRLLCPHYYEKTEKWRLNKSGLSPLSLRHRNCFNMPPLLPNPAVHTSCMPGRPVLQPSAPLYREEREEAQLQLSKQVFNLLAGSSSRLPHRQTRTRADWHSRMAQARLPAGLRRRRR